MPDTSSIHVIKIGGNELDDREFLQHFVDTVRAVRGRGIRPVIVHGGGQEIVRLHDELGVPFDIVQGLRVTSDQSMRLVKMALDGIANTRVVRWLVNGGLDAIGLNGVDMGLIRVEKMIVTGVDLGRVGKVTEVNASKLLPFIDAGLVPVISPISLGYDGFSYNVNADYVAESLAVALNAASLVFITNVPGVMIAGQPIRVLPVEQVEDLIFGQFITGGMIPKVRAAVSAIELGVANTIITDLDHYAKGEGTIVVRHP